MKIGVDLGGTNTVVGICSDDGKLLKKDSLPTPKGDADGLRANMLKLALSLCDEVGIAPGEVRQIGIGAPGTFDKERCTLTFGTNLGMNNLNFSEIFQRNFKCPVWLDNDGNCAALGEYTSGAGRDTQNMVMVTLGTGIGGGIIIRGKLYAGENHIAGEIGHMVIQFDGLQCNCGRKGCFEAYASASGMIRLAELAMNDGAPTSLIEKKAQNSGRLMAKMICDARDENDALAIQIFDQYIAYLACGINNIIATLQPQKIVFGGGVAGYGEKLMQPLRMRVAQELMKSDCAQSALVLATLGNDAGIVGAAMLES